MQQWSGRNRRRVTCWRSRRAVADGGARVLVCGLRGGEPGISTARHRAQSMCRRKEEVDEARPRRRRSQWSRALRSRSARGQIHYAKVVKPCNPNKKEVRARRRPWNSRQVGPWRGGRGELREVLKSSQTRRDKHERAGAATLASARVPPPGGGSRLGKLRFFLLMGRLACFSGVGRWVAMHGAEQLCCAHCYLCIIGGLTGRAEGSLGRTRRVGD